jgi:hypothetical protein
MSAKVIAKQNPRQFDAGGFENTFALAGRE